MCFVLGWNLPALLKNCIAAWLSFNKFMFFNWNFESGDDPQDFFCGLGCCNVFRFHCWHCYASLNFTFPYDGIPLIWRCQWTAKFVSPPIRVVKTDYIKMFIFFCDCNFIVFGFLKVSQSLFTCLMFCVEGDCMNLLRWKTTVCKCQVVILLLGKLVIQ